MSVPRNSSPTSDGLQCVLVDRQGDGESGNLVSMPSFVTGPLDDLGPQFPQLYLDTDLTFLKCFESEG